VHCGFSSISFPGLIKNSLLYGERRVGVKRRPKDKVTLQIILILTLTLHKTFTRRGHGSVFDKYLHWPCVSVYIYIYIYTCIPSYWSAMLIQRAWKCIWQIFTLALCKCKYIYIYIHLHTKLLKCNAHTKSCTCKWQNYTCIAIKNIATSRVNAQMFFLCSRVKSHSIGIPTKIRGLGKGGGWVPCNVLKMSPYLWPLYPL
jgi:hypothetical protein